jgi:hypothetical protein
MTEKREWENPSLELIAQAREVLAELKAIETKINAKFADYREPAFKGGLKLNVTSRDLDLLNPEAYQREITRLEEALSNPILDRKKIEEQLEALKEEQRDLVARLQMQQPYLLVNCSLDANFGYYMYPEKAYRWLDGEQAELLQYLHALNSQDNIVVTRSDNQQDRPTEMTTAKISRRVIRSTYFTVKVALTPQGVEEVDPPLVQALRNFNASAEALCAGFQTRWHDEVVFMVGQSTLNVITDMTDGTLDETFANTNEIWAQLKEEGREDLLSLFASDEEQLLTEIDDMAMNAPNGPLMTEIWMELRRGEKPAEYTDAAEDFYLALWAKCAGTVKPLGARFRIDQEPARKTKLYQNGFKFVVTMWI